LDSVPGTISIFAKSREGLRRLPKYCQKMPTKWLGMSDSNHAFLWGAGALAMSAMQIDENWKCISISNRYGLPLSF
jgi:hypothetical protein